MYGLGGMWFFGLFLVVPILIGVATTSRSIYRFLVARGVSRNNALTASVVGTLLMLGVMTSPLFLGAAPVRVAVGIAYLTFIFLGGREIVNFFTGGDRKAKKNDGATKDGDEDCGCDHDGKEDDGNGHKDVKKPSAQGDEQGDQKPHRRTPSEARAEIERRLKEDKK